jgi:small subunit ribosomal protein S12
MAPWFFILMSTYNQLLKNKRRKSLYKSRSSALEKAPQKRGLCIKVYIMTPKKPNSAKRKVASIELSNGKKIIAYIPGIGHNLQQYGHVLVRGGRVPDLPGMHYILVRGKYDLQGILARRHSRSRYGTRWWFR